MHAVPRPDVAPGEHTRGVPSGHRRGVGDDEGGRPPHRAEVPFNRRRPGGGRVGVSGRVNIRAQLRAPLVVRTRKVQFTVNQVSFWVDDPRQAAARIRDRVDTRTGA